MKPCETMSDLKLIERESAMSIWRKGGIYHLDLIGIKVNSFNDHSMYDINAEQGREIEKGNDCEIFLDDFLAQRFDVVNPFRR